MPTLRYGTCSWSEKFCVGPFYPAGTKPGDYIAHYGTVSLVDAILKGVRAGSTVSPAEAGAAARKVGYKSSSPNFGMMVANALSKDSRFKRIGRGQYRLAGGKASAKPAAKTKPASKKRGRRVAKKKAAAKKAVTSQTSSSLGDVVARS